ncbi:hypothetical protein E2320_004863, partial [Naja naja]
SNVTLECIIFNSVYFSLKLHNEDDPAESTVEQPSTSTETAPACPTEAPLPEVDTSPPPYCTIATEAAAPTEESRCSFTEVESPNEFYPVPPPYSVATSLPTYDEAEKAKAAAMAAVAAEAAAQRHGHFRESRSLFDEIFLSPPEVFFVLLKEEEYPPRDDFSDADQLRVGNDGIFMLAFFSHSQITLLAISMDSTGFGGYFLYLVASTRHSFLFIKCELPTHQ